MVTRSASVLTAVTVCGALVLAGLGIPVAAHPPAGSECLMEHPTEQGAYCMLWIEGPFETEQVREVSNSANPITYIGLATITFSCNPPPQLSEIVNCTATVPGMGPNGPCDTWNGFADSCTEVSKTPVGIEGTGNLICLEKGERIGASVFGTHEEEFGGPNPLITIDFNC